MRFFTPPGYDRKQNNSQRDKMKSMEEENYKVLDKIDFIPYFKKHRTLSSVISAVNNDNDGKELTQNEVCQGYVFNQFDESQIEEYLRKRYGDKLRMQEITTTYINYD